MRAYQQDDDDFSTQHPFPLQHQPQVYYQAVPYPAYTVHPQQQQIDGYYNPYNNAEYADFISARLLHDDFADMEEISTRPRLTREQVEVLEAQFQANHKPNTQVKKQLAIQTNLGLQRVGVGFHQRRGLYNQADSCAELVSKSTG